MPTPNFNTVSALLQANLDSLRAIDAGDQYDCLDVDCCAYDTQQVTNWFSTTTILLQYLLTQSLPTWDVCCEPTCGTLTGGTPDIFTSPSFADLTVTDDLTTLDLIMTGAFTRNGVVQPIYRSGTGTLAAGTATVTASWVTANTVIVVSYNTASAAGEANISRGAITPGASFVVNGEGTNTFSWIAIQNA